MAPRRGPADEIGVANFIVFSVLAAGCGFLTFNFGHIVSLSREVIHESLAQQHHLDKEYCAYTKCSLNKHHSRKDAFGLITGSRKEKMEERERLDKLMYPDAPPETVQALTSRVCEKDTVSDVEEDVVDVKCLEGSPTALWMEEYYRLGHRHQDLNVFINKFGDFEGVELQKGLAIKVGRAEDCAAACLMTPSHTASGALSSLPCNAFSFCSAEVCFEAGKGKQTRGDCWLQFIEAPGAPLRKYRGSAKALSSDSSAHLLGTHGQAQWWGGLLLPRGMAPANATVLG
uniref:Apple domain-containing protein n=1 Tax=Chlamydomonas euryale TaxID=1486919 RepID=A0A7R9V3A2_9CHLO|mmetsp:Transcript_13322/g.38706  ORF Transcript_13322/g.38706 Transcript_13322/m.38706 type:complete len:287 (+) Transcript_13322:122-982(+)